MSLPNFLSTIKSSGMYRRIIDKSQLPVVEANNHLRLVVGYSEKGPFNQPVYIKGKDEFKKIYGDINKRMEKKGLYFHRLALQCLDSGLPIICLNLKPFTNEKVSAITFNGTQLTEATSLDIQDIYNTSRFWELDSEKLNSKFLQSSCF